MDPAEIEVFDLHRMLIGDTPWTFTLEILVRTLVMYLYTFGLVRLLTRRTVGQLSLIEVLLIVGLGSAVGDPMFYPDVPLLHGLAVITSVVGVNYAISAIGERSERFETLVEGMPTRVVHNGLIDVAALKRLQLPRDQLFEQLRLGGVEHLGEVRAAYLEQNGHISIFRRPEAEVHAGLAIEPPPDLRARDALEAGGSVAVDGWYACLHCGRTRRLAGGDSVPDCECGEPAWVNRVKEPAAARTQA